MHVQRGEGAGSREGQLAGGGEGWGDADGLGWHLVRKVYPQSDGPTSSRPLSQRAGAEQHTCVSGAREEGGEQDGLLRGFGGSALLLPSVASRALWP